MDEPAGTSDGKGEASETPARVGLAKVIDIVPTGDLILDVTFENSKDTLKVARAVPKLTSRQTEPTPKPRVHLWFRVDSSTLKRQSKYFEKLLGDTRFKEGKDLADAFVSLSLRNIKPAVADGKDLPRVKIIDDDEATRYAYRDSAFADMLKILHGKEATTSSIKMDFITTLAVFADRFDCTGPVSKFMSTSMKFKWPVTYKKPVSVEDASMSRATENTLRQKILVSWLLNQPVKFQAAARELILNGSCKWTAFPEEDDTGDATWWYLQDGLERKNCPPVR